MKNTRPTILTFSSWAAQTYTTKREAVEYLANSLDPVDRALGTVIKIFAEMSNMNKNESVEDLNLPQITNVVKGNIWEWFEHCWRADTFLIVNKILYKR